MNKTLLFKLRHHPIRSRSVPARRDRLHFASDEAGMNRAKSGNQYLCQ
jgi:hypothetical protein